MNNLLEFRVGLLTILALLLFVFLVGKVEDVQPFRHVYRFGVTFYDVQRLVVGDPVRLNGLPVGKVKLMHLQKGLVLVWLEIDEQYKILRKSKFTIGTAGFFGANYIKIKQPLAEDTGPAQYVAPEEVVTGLEEPGIDRLIEEGQQIFASMRVTFDALNKILGDADFREDVKLTARSMRQASGRAEELVKHIDDRLAEVTKDLRSVLNNVNGTITDNRAKLTQSLESLRRLTDELNKTVEENRANLRQITSNIRTTTEQLNEKGGVGKRIREALANLERLTNDYSARGEIGREFSETARNATEITVDLKEVTGRLRDVATDPATEDKVGQAFDDVHALREQSEELSAITTKVTFDLPSNTLYDIDRERLRGDATLVLGYDDKYFGWVGQEDIGRAHGINVVQLGTRIFEDFIVRSGAFRFGLENRNGIGIDAHLLGGRAVLSAEAVRMSDPEVRVIGKYKINEQFDAMVRREGINQGVDSTLIGVQSHF